MYFAAALVCTNGVTERSPGNRRAAKMRRDEPVIVERIADEACALTVRSVQKVVRQILIATAPTTRMCRTNPSCTPERHRAFDKLQIEIDLSLTQHLPLPRSA